MRTTVIPAQITTVEDKIAGSLNMTQVFILMTPVFFGVLVYAFFPPLMHLEIYKILLTAVVVVFALILSLRIKGKVVANWLIVLLTYNLRPRFYLFNKNDIYQREVYLPKTIQKVNKKAALKKKVNLDTNLSKDIAKIERYIKDPKYDLSLKPNKKGGLYVALNEIE